MFTLFPPLRRAFNRGYRAGIMWGADAPCPYAPKQRFRAAAWRVGVYEGRKRALSIWLESRKTRGGLDMYI